MNRRQVLFGRILCVWTVFVFGVLIKNMIVDDEHEMAFRLVHSAIGAVSIVLAVLAWPREKAPISR